VGEIDFPDLIARSEKIEENVLIDAMLGKIEVKSMYRRLRAILPRDVAPGTTGGQDIQNPVEHRPMVGSWSPDMRFLRREMRLNDCPEFFIDFPECHTSRVLFKTSYNCGMTSTVILYDLITGCTWADVLAKYGTKSEICEKGVYQAISLDLLRLGMRSGKSISRVALPIPRISEQKGVDRLLVLIVVWL
jgi:hypothetical protein